MVLVDVANPMTWNRERTRELMTDLIAVIIMMMTHITDSPRFSLLDHVILIFPSLT